MAIVSNGPRQETGDQKEEAIHISSHIRIGTDTEVGAARVLHEPLIPLSVTATEAAGILHCFVHHHITWTHQ